MLVLSRDEVKSQVRIGDNVIAKVISIRGGRVRLGFEAPPEVAIHREEVYQQIQKGAQQ